MGGAVKSVAKAVTGGGSSPAPAPTPTPVAEPVRATKAETQAARERQATLRARRGSGASLISYSRTLGSQSTLPGEDM